MKDLGKYFNHHWELYFGIGLFLFFFLYIASLSPLSQEIFIGIFFFTLAIALLKKSNLVVFFFPMVMLQVPQPVFEKSQYVNWIYGDLFNVSIVHFISLLVLLVALGKRGSLREKFGFKREAVALLVLLIFGMAIGLLINSNYFYHFIIDLLIVITALSWYYASKEVNFSKIHILFSWFMILPAIMIWGTTIVELLGYRFDIWGPIFGKPYLATSPYLISGVTLLGFSYKKLSRSIRLLYISSFLLIIIKMFLFKAPQIGGSIEILVVIFSLGIIGITKLYSSSNLTEGVSYLLIFSLIVIIIWSSFLFYIQQTGNRWLKMKIKQITSIFTLNPYQMRYSTSVRALELMNTYAGILDNNPLLLIFGKGFGGFFRDQYFPYPYFGKRSYPQKQIERGRFFNAHNSPGYLFLKNGLLGLLVLVYLGSKLTLGYMKRKEELFFLAVMSGITFLTVWGFTVKNSIILGTGLGLIHAVERNQRSMILKEKDEIE